MNKQLLLLLICCNLFSVSAIAQSKNILLDRNFWKSQPSMDEVKHKVKEGHSPTAFNPYNFDAICYAILENNDLETIKYLLSQGNDVNKITHDARTYLFWAAYKNNLDLVKYLVKNGAKTDVIDQHGYSVMIFAAVAGQNDKKLYDYLIKEGANLKKEKDRDGKNAMLIYTSGMKDISFLSYFIKKGLDINSTDKNGNGIFHYAAKTGDIEVLKSLIKKYKVNYKKNEKTNENAILFASNRSTRSGETKTEFFEYLIGLGLDPNIVSTEGKNVLHNLAYRSKSVDLFNYFIKKGVNVNQQDKSGNTPLLNAASGNKLEIIKLLVEKSTDINITNKEGLSPIAKALKSNSLEIVKYLVSKGAKLDALDAKGYSLGYHMVNSYNGRIDAFKEKFNYLIQKGFDAKALQQDQSTLLHIAIKKEDIALLEYLVSLQIDINAKDKNGQTVLHIAAMNAKDEAVLKFLLEAGADKNIKTEFEETVHDLAKENELLSQKNIDIEFLK